MDLLGCALILASLWIAFYFYIKTKYSYWSSRGIAGPTPSFFQLGNVLQLAGEISPPEDEVALITQFGLIYGTYTCLTPTLQIADAAIIRQIMVKDFQHFIDRRHLNTYHEIVNNTQLFAEGAKWKRIRSITSSAFTSRKLRSMIPWMDRSCNELVKYFNHLIDNGSETFIAQKVFCSFTVDVVASAAFATETNAIADMIKHQPEANPLVAHFLAMCIVPPLQALCFLAMPRWFNDLIGVRHIFNEQSIQFMTQYIRVIVERRRSGAEKRDDMLQLLVDSSVDEEALKDGDYGKLEADMEKDDTHQASASKTKGTIYLTDDEIISQAMLFFGAAFQTTTLTLTHIIFELSQHVEVQERLISELHEALDGLEPTSAEYHDRLMALPYLDAIIKETLRKYTPLARIERVCNLDGYEITPGLQLRKNQVVEVSTYAVHYNPDYYPKPHLFDPERFLPENKHLVVPYSFIPLGVGPRNCVGMRYAYQNIKMCLGAVFRQFRVKPTEQTPTKLSFDQFKLAIFSKYFESKIERQ